jgi:hypothetical protein
MLRSARLAALSLVLAAQALAGDLTIAMQGKGRFNEGPQTHMWSAKFMRINNPGGQDTLVDYEKGITYTIDHKKKVIQKMAWDDLEASIEAMAQQMKDMPAFMAKMMPGGEGGEVTVTDGGKEVVIGRTCIKKTIAMGKTVFETSNDPTLKPPVPVVAYARFLKLRNLMGAMGPAAEGMKKMGEELAKIQGMALKTRTVLPIVGEMTTEATEVKEGPIPATAFALPEGYKLEDLGQKMLKGRR